MALATAAWGFDGKSYTGKDMRLMVEAVAPNAGVATPAGLAVTQNGGGATTVLVAAGQAVIDATGAGLLGSYAAWNDASLASPAFAATTTNGRKDRLILRVTAGVPALEIVQGTAAPSPTEPAITGDNYLELALVTLPASTTNILTSMITDRRALASAAGATVIATSATRPSPSYEGQQIYETDTDTIQLNVNGAWTQIGPLTGWTSYTPTLTQSGAVTKTVTYAKWMRVGRAIWVQVDLLLTGAGTANNAILVGLPVTAARSTGIVGSGQVFDTGTARYEAVCTLNSTTTFGFWRADAPVPGGLIGVDPNYAVANADAVYASIMYEST